MQFATAIFYGNHNSTMKDREYTYAALRRAKADVNHGYPGYHVRVVSRNTVAPSGMRTGKQGMRG